jgi:tripartite-type tricarboxylate transporter receptor subunit TctC
MIVPFAAGGAADVVARLMAQGMSEALGQQVVVENRGGSGGVLGSEAALAAPADGYSFAFHTLSSAVINAGLYRNLSFDVRQAFLPVSLVGVLPNVILVNGRFPARNLAELIALLRANPGRYDYASSGPGTPYHIAGEVFLSMAGVQAQHIPFRGSNEARTALVAGQVPIMFDAIPTVREQVVGGRVRGLATTGPSRNVLLPDLPTVAETLPGYEASIWLGVMAPAGTPEPILGRLNAEINAYLRRPETREAQSRAGAEPLVMSMAEFDAFLRADITRQAEYIRLARITPS